MTAQSTLITVSELTFAIKNQLESRFKAMQIQGEVSNAKLHSSGHLYFDLKDAEAKISAVMFRPQAQLLKRPPKEGDHVIIKGDLSLYPPHGKYQIIARSLDYLGLGELLLKLEALKKKLASLGWFDKSHKKPLPKFPRTIGVITSPTGAVIRDIIHVLTRRFSGFHLILNPVRVQGPEASFEIAQAIEEFNKYRLADVLIVGRGGGSLEDLFAFNEERVAKAIFESQIPIISAVGHETDVTIADFVADMRAPTPSAAAEIVSAEKAHHVEVLIKTRKNLLHSLYSQLRHTRMRLEGICRLPFLANPYSLLSHPLQKMDEIKIKLDKTMHMELVKKRLSLQARAKQAAALKPTERLALYRTRLNSLQLRARERMAHLLEIKNRGLKGLTDKLRAVDPKQVLKRGYSILFAEKQDSIIVSSRALKPGQEVKALMSDGSATLTVHSVD